MAQGEGAPAGDKKVEAPKTLEDALTLIGTLTETVTKVQGQLKETTEESIKRKEKLRAIEQERADAESAKLKEKGQFEDLVKTLEPKAKRADELEKALKGYYDLEVADVPEEKRALIPDGSVELQLSWLKTAKAQGLFTGGNQQELGPDGKPKQKTPVNSNQGKGKGDAPAEFLTFGADDQRLQSLTPAQYAQWKQHNGRDTAAQGGNHMTAWGKLPV